jgi:hypothetical protein
MIERGSFSAGRRSRARDVAVTAQIIRIDFRAPEPKHSKL